MNQAETAFLEAESRRAEALAQTLLLVALVVGVTLALSLIMGRAGERIATQLCVSIAAIVSLAVFSGNSGIVSFGHAAFMGLGAYLSGILTMPAAIQASALPNLPAFLADYELGLFASLAVVALFGAMVALLIGLPISRLSGASATIATLGILIIVHSVLVGTRDITRGSQTFFGVPRVTTLEIALGAAIVFICLARLYRESRYGLMLRAVRDNEPAAIAMGIEPRRARLIAWVASGALATVAGALYGHMLGAFSPRDFYFALTFSMVAMLVVGGMLTVSGAVVGVIVVTLLQDSVRQIEGGFALGPLEVPQIFGLTTATLGIVILLVIWLRPRGLLGYREASLPFLERLAARAMRRLDSLVPVRHEHEGVEADAEPGHSRDSVSIDGLTKHFKGLTAVDDASFAVPAGKVTGLIGPNGAGKSTIVNLMTGQLPASAGAVRLGTFNLLDLPAYRIAHLGVARTFQNNRLFEDLTVYENVLVPALAIGATRQEAAQRVARELNALDLLDVAHDRAGSLPYGARKRLEIARCLSLRPILLVLDEPAAGMNPEETADLAERLDHLGHERGYATLLIDHDLGFVNRLSSSIVVVNRGRVIAVGSPEQIQTNPDVIEAYIGTGRARSEEPEPVPLSPSIPFTAKGETP